MSLILLAAATRSPGVTTTAVGMALSWPRAVLLVDADPHPSQAVLAGYLQGEDPHGLGLWSVLAAHRERRPLAPAIEHARMELPTADGIPRHFLPGFANPGMVELFGTAWPEFAAVLADWRTDVLVDAGRLGNRGLPPALAAEADAVLVVTRSSLVDLVGLRLYLPLLTEVVPPEKLSLLLVGPGRPYTAGEISAQFGLRVEEPVPWSPAEAEVWSSGAAPGRGFAAGAYVRGVRRAAAGVRERLDRFHERIGAPR